jgi:hypothetical protein
MLGKELLVRLGLDGSGYSLGLKRMESLTARWGRSIRSSLMGYVGAAFSAHMVSRGIRDLVEFGSVVDDLSKRTGMSTDQIQALNYVLSQNGVEINELGASFDRLADSMHEATENETSQAAKAFRQLGIDAKALQGQNIGRVFEDISRSVQSMGNRPEVADALRDLLGRSGGKMIPAMKDGMAGITDEVKRLGAVIDEDLIKKIDKAGDAWTTMAIKFRAATAPVATQLYRIIGLNFEAVSTGWRVAAKIPENLVKTGSLTTAWLSSMQQVAEEMVRKPTLPSQLNDNVKPLPEPPAAETVTKIVRSVIDPSLSGMSRQGIFLRGLPAGEQNIPKLQLNELKKIEKNTKDKGDTIIVP